MEIQNGGNIMKLSVKTEKSVIDPVCGMDVVPAMTEIKATMNGETYYFCAEGCRNSFIEHPEKFLSPKPAKKKGWWCRYAERLEKATGGKSMNCH
jgi:YHS domain-containing protein